MGSLSDKLNLYELSTRTLRSPSLSISSRTSSSTDTASIKRLRFDDRSTTKTSLALKQYRDASVKTKEELLQQRPSPSSAADSKIHGMFSWSPLRKINESISDEEVMHVTSNSIYIAVALGSSDVIIFNYKQAIEVRLDTEEHNRNPSAKITSLAFSSDSTHFVAGYEDGVIRIWDMNSNRSPSVPSVVRPHFIIPPKSSHPDEHEEFQGHQLNSAIKYVDFIQQHNHLVVSVDESGSMLHHKLSRKLMKKHVKTERLVAFNNMTRKNLPSKILKYGQLPLGSSPQITDEMGVVALLTQNTLTIASVVSLNDPDLTNMVTHFKLTRSGTRNGNEESDQHMDSLSTAMNWYPCTRTSRGINNAKLACSWHDTLNIIELDNNCLPSNLIRIVHDAKDKDKAVPKLPFRRTCKWQSSSAIVDLKWASSDVLCVFVQSEDNEIHIKTFHYDGSLLVQIAEDEMEGGVRRINTAKQSFLVLRRDSKLFLGRQLSWADILLKDVSTGNYVDALFVTNEYYQTTSRGKLTAVGLPVNKEKRLQVLRPYLVEIMRESLPLLSKADSANSLNIYFDVIAYVGNTEMLEDILEALHNDEKFFDTLESYILFGTLSVLPPAILRRLVEYYASARKGELLTEILCTLDIKSLDIDLAIQLCTKYKLRDCLIYIWNVLLNDYEAPFIEFIAEFGNAEAAFIGSEDYYKAYAYMSYILTGRQYPTDRYIPHGEREAALAICNILFSSGPVQISGKVIPTTTTGTNAETIFPYLYVFLHADSFQMLSTLNEFFESSFLNEDPKYTRQYLIEALLDLFEANKQNFTDFDKAQLAIFIARNYPKYSQLIRLSESTLDSVVDTLCRNADASIVEDCELALQSLVSLYVPEDTGFEQKLESAGFYGVLVDLYNSQGKYSRALESWLLKNGRETATTITSSTTPAAALVGEISGQQLMDLIHNSFSKIKVSSEKINIIKVLKNNFEKFAKLDVQAFYTLIEKYAPHAHAEVLNVKDDAVAYQYTTMLLTTPDLKWKDFLPRHLQLMIRLEESKVFAFVELWSAQLVASEQKHLDEMLKLLHDHELVDAEACLLVCQNEYVLAIDCILEFLKQKKTDSESSFIDAACQDRFVYLLEYAMKICERPETYDVQVSQDLNLNEQLWLKIIHTLVEVANHAASNHIAGQNFINHCIHECFRTMSDSKLNNSKREQSFLVIFNKFLAQYTTTRREGDEDEEHNEAKIASLSNIRGILQEVFISYSYDSEMLKISFKMLNDDVYKNMLIIRDNKLRGWMIKAAQVCSSCGKWIGGGGGGVNGSGTGDNGLPEAVLDPHVLAWEDRQRGGIKSQLGSFKFLELIYFECGHAYHSTCLEKLQSYKKCVLCHH
ncbi:uncharacterized protein LODBEIA_P22330 [Lodderomyces beijingensis]|uniref:Vacuolar protein sorting-associated protein 8 central domain-containing protein n=1 Tax=Lodderomyces beijingensis TaxID=1775926 RepID=A0ABP0ZIN9_9ASCO